MTNLYFIDIPIVIISYFEALNVVKVKSIIDNGEFYVDKKYIKDKPQKKENSLSISQLRGY